MSEEPLHWKTVKLGDPDFAFTASGGTPDRSHPEYFSGTIPWVKSGELDDNWIFDTEEKITEEGLAHSAAKRFPAGTLLVAMYGATAGKTAILRIEAATNQAICAIFPRNGSFEPEFLQFCLIHTRPSLLRRRSGGAQPNISQTVITSLEVFLPPLPEQRAIARALRAIQEAKEARRRELALERERRAALMEFLFTHGTRGEPLKATEIGKVPASWDVVSLGDVASRMQYGLSVRGNPIGQYPMLRMNNLVDGKIDATNLQYVDLDTELFESFRLTEGDLLFNRTNSHDLVGKMAIAEAPDQFVFASYLIRITIKGAEVSPAYINAYFNWGEVQRRLKMLASRGVSQANISANRLRKFPIPLPDSFEEQAEIARFLELCFRKMATLEQECFLLDEFFRAVLEELMTARLSAIPLIEP